MKVKPENLEKALESGKEFELEFSKQKIPELHETVKAVLAEGGWMKNSRITNKREERKRFLKCMKQGDRYRPKFEFEEKDQENLKQIIEQAKNAAERIGKEELERYGAKKITAEQIRRFYSEIFDELRLFIDVSGAEEQSWREASEKIWPMVDEERFRKSKQKMREIEKKEEEKELDSSDLASMFRKEIERLGMDWDVEIRDVPGCYNDPSEKKVIVADGASGEERRFYSREEAEMLTVHEVFHSARAYNGYQASENGLPPILAIQTPFYDSTEEGGAVYREMQTGTHYSAKEFDYHLRLVASYLLSESDDFEEQFQEIAENLVELGASETRAFDLLARNREALRHHIYLGGVKDWSEASEKKQRKLLLGKVNPDYAEMFGEEMEAGGMISEPEVTAEQLFDFSFKDS